MNAILCVCVAAGASNVSRFLRRFIVRRVDTLAAVETLGHLITSVRSDVAACEVSQFPFPVYSLKSSGTPRLGPHPASTRVPGVALLASSR